MRLSKNKRMKKDQNFEKRLKQKSHDNLKTKTCNPKKYRNWIENKLKF